MTEIKVSLTEKMWEAMKGGVVFPVDDKDLEAEPEAVGEKLDSYANSRKMFLRVVEIMACSLLPQLSPQSKKVVLTLRGEDGR